MAKMRFPCELALIFGLLLTSISVCFFLKSGFGVTVITSVPLAISYIVPSINFGVWNIIFQLFLMLLAVIILRVLQYGYIISIILAVSYGFLIDLMEPLVFSLPFSSTLALVYFALSMALLSFGFAFFMRCHMPLLPYDTLVRGTVLKYKIPYIRLKTLCDIICLATSVGLLLGVVGELKDIGIGTIVSAVITGTCVSYVMKFLDKHFDFEPAVPAVGRFIKSEEAMVEKVRSFAK